MEYRPLSVTVISAEGIKDVKLLSKMDVYAEASIAGSKKRTPVHKNCGTSPRWNCRMEFMVDEPYLRNPGLSLLFQLMAESTFSTDKLIGSVIVPIHDLFQQAAAEDRIVECHVQTASGKPKGSLKFSYRFGEKFKQQERVDHVQAKNRGDEPVTAYPAVPYPHPAAAGAYPPSGYPQPSGHGYGYGYQQPPPPPPGYGYPPAGYAAAQKPKKSRMGGLGMGLGAGLLGGLLLGEVASDFGDASAYADGYDDAMGDMGGFDF